MKKRSDFLNKIKRPIPYYGSKEKIAPVIVGIIKKGDWSTQYIEPFVGSNSILLQDDFEGIKVIINDFDGKITNIWRSLRYRPAETASYIQGVCNTINLTGLDLAVQRSYDALLDRLHADIEYCDPKLAAYFIDLCCSWIGSGAGNTTGPWSTVKDEDGVDIMVRLDKGEVTCTQGNCGSDIGVRCKQGQYSDMGVRCKQSQYSGNMGIRCTPSDYSGSDSGVGCKQSDYRDKGVRCKQSQYSSSNGVRCTPSQYSGNTGVSCQQSNYSGNTGVGCKQSDYRDKGIRCQQSDYRDKGIRCQQSDKYIEWFTAISKRLSDTSILSHDFEKILNLHVITSKKTTIFFDPPYDTAGDMGGGVGYITTDHNTVSGRVRKWCIDNNEALGATRIIVAGRGIEHDELLNYGYEKIDGINIKSLNKNTLVAGNTKEYLWVKYEI